MDSKKLDRRTFLQDVTAGSFTLSALGAGASAVGQDKKNLKMGLIGCGWYGMVDLRAAFKAGGVEVLALCDVDREHLDKSAEEVEKLQGRRPQTFKSYDDLLKTPGLEAVIIATPPHWHALQFIAACRKELDIYCEKPLAYDIREGRAMVEAAGKSRGIVQIGFQRRQASGFRQVREYLESGQAGRIVSVDAQIHYTAGLKDATPQKPPDSLDWDLWCGPAPKIPYSPQVGHMNWRLEKTTGHGHLVDWGIHLMDAARWILGENAPRSVSASGGLYYLQGKITTPDVLTAHFEFERCPLTWRHRIWGAEEFTPEVSNGLFFYGEKETVFVTDDRWIVIPRGKSQERKVNQVKSDAGLLHMSDFLEAVRTRKSPACRPEDAYLSTTAVKLAMIAYDCGTKINWDSKSERILGNSEAAKHLKRNYRAPYKHPYAG
jgi:predicted dehydrogenase